MINPIESWVYECVSDVGGKEQRQINDDTLKSCGITTRSQVDALVGGLEEQFAIGLSGCTINRDTKVGVIIAYIEQHLY